MGRCPGAWRRRLQPGRGAAFSATISPVPQSPAWTWDVFCRVIDNYGDAGVAWRLARELGARGQQVRLWLDDAGLLDRLAPGARQGRFAGVRVLRWTCPLPADAWAQLPPSHVWIEAFGCDLPLPFVAWRRQHEAVHGQPVWINLEYLSAEAFPRRAHGLPSPVSAGPAAGWTKWFFYPGFDRATGGLLRERDLPRQQADFDGAAWLRVHAPDLPAARGARRLSLFCYEPPALPALLRQLDAAPEPQQLLVTAGRASAAVRALVDGPGGQSLQPAGGLAISHLPFLTQAGFDRLLWSCDLNFVRGEDSLVRALWAGKPFVWQPYPQGDGVHADKLAAFLAWLQPPAAVRALHRTWSGLGDAPLPVLAQLDWPAWTRCVQRARERLLAQPDLVTQLIEFIRRKR